MKKQIYLLITVLILFNSKNSFAQCDYCGQILEKGIFNKYEEYSESDFNEFLDIILTKDKSLFTSEYNEDGSSKGADAAYGAFSGGYDENKLSISEKERLELIKIYYAQNNEISNSDRQFITRKTASKAITASWERCVINCPNSGLIIKSDGDPNGDEFIVSVEWLPSNKVESDDNAGVKVTNIQVTNGEIIGDGNLRKDGVLKPFGSLITKIKRTKPDNDLTISISTDKYGLQKKNISKVEKNNSNDLPVGTIVQSVLSYKNFMKLNDQSPEFTNESVWAPCDGRRIPIDAKYRIYADNAPDLRGVFIRGLNQFYPNNEGTNALASERMDIDGKGRRANSFQSDAFQGHKHFKSKTLSFHGGSPHRNPNHPNNDPHWTNHSNSAGVHDEGFGKPRVSNETRSKNVAVYFYIKIN